MDDTPAVLPRRWASLSHKQKSSLVLRRAAIKLAVFVLAAGAQTLLGYGFVSALGSLLLLTSLLSVFFGMVGREQVRAPNWTFFDEGAWFALLGHALVRLG